MEQTYKRNLEALYEVNRTLYDRLLRLGGNERFEVFAGKEPIDVNIVDSGNKLPLYNEPISDTELRISALGKYLYYPFICFFGLGNGFLFKALLRNKPLNHLVIFEPEIEIIYIALHLNDLAADIKKLRLMIIHTDDFESSLAMSICKMDTVLIFLKLYDLHITVDYYSRYTTKIERVNSVMVDAIIQSVKTHGNDVEDALVGLDNFLENSVEMVSNIPFDELRKKKNSEIVITVATGPSLTKQLPILKAAQEYVTIICVDASLPILEKWDIVPDIVTSLERVELTSQFYEKTSEAFQKKVGCFAISALAHPRTLAAIKGRKCLIMRPFGYMVAFDLTRFGYAGIGMSAANLAYELAFIMGYKYIAMIGQDLAYSKDEKTTHAGDHIFGASDPSVDKYKNSEQRIMIPAWGGDGEIRTNEIWIMFRNFFITYIADTQNKMITYNCTEGGCHIDGAIDEPFQKIIDQYAAAQKIKEHYLFADATDDQLANDKKTIKSVINAMIKEADQALAELTPIFEQLTAFAEELEKLPIAEQLKKADFKRVDRLNDSITAFKARLKDPIFAKYFWETLRATVINQELNIAKIIVRIPTNTDEKHTIALEFLFAHRLWFFSVSNALLAQRAILKKYA